MARIAPPRSSSHAEAITAFVRARETAAGKCGRGVTSQLASHSSPVVRPGTLRNRRGPHTGQALGCAWNRRSDGSRYSASHSSHMGKSRMVVIGRS